MSHSIYNNEVIPIEEGMDKGQGLDGQASCNILNNPSTRPQASPSAGSQATPRIVKNLSGILPVNLDNPNYGQTLVSKFMKQIPPMSPVNPSKQVKIADKVARPNLKTYDGKYDLIKLESGLGVWRRSLSYLRS